MLPQLTAINSFRRRRRVLRLRRYHLQTIARLSPLPLTVTTESQEKPLPSQEEDQERTNADEKRFFVDAVSKRAHTVVDPGARVAEESSSQPRKRGPHDHQGTSGRTFSGTPLLRVSVSVSFAHTLLASRARTCLASPSAMSRAHTRHVPDLSFPIARSLLLALCSFHLYRNFSLSPLPQHSPASTIVLRG